MGNNRRGFLPVRFAISIEHKGTIMDWNKKNLLRVGDYFYFKLKDCISEARLSLNEEEKKALSGVLDQISPSGLLHVVRFYPQFSNWGNFLKENNCEQYDKNDFWVIFSKMATRQLPVLTGFPSEPHAAILTRPVSEPKKSILT